ncbi:tetratricopeptide repeat protein [Streptomyces sp. NPDC057877]|uniref:caspase, EACC1-associated type n=1 Tax=Streptomyces sp. NPDC057877 TaxID=3346269 RepID=UPI0036BD07B9
MSAGASPDTRLEQTGSRAVLCGVHAYQHLPGLDGVRHNVPALRELLVAQDVGLFAGEHCVAVPANSTPAQLLDAVQDAADHAKDLLLVYYAGHGHFGRDGRSLLLGTEASRPDRPHHSVSYDEIRAIVAGSRARHRVVVVDCCFSGAALHMDAGQDGPPARKAPVFEIEGACVLTSAAETERSLCLPDGSVFTRELVRLLRDGVSGELSDGRKGTELSVLTMADVYDVLRQRLGDRAVEGHPVPLPRMSTRDGGHRIPLAVNRAYAPPTPVTGTPAATAAPAAPLSTAYDVTRNFTGRAAELTALERTAVEQPAAVCVVHGRGGQGKTELLRALAARTTHLFPGGCLEVDLRGWTPGEQPRDPYMVIAEQLHHMGHAPEDVPADLTARAETWRLFLKQNPVLLLLDNARDARQLAPLLPSAGSPSMVIISSRSELPEVNAHQRFELPPLTAADCVTVWHKMGIPQDTAHLDEIADRVNGSPLALGPIGTRLLHGASPTAVLHSLTGQHRYATFPSIDTAERAAFTTAYASLDADLRHLIHHCAWHPGPDFGPDSLAAMAERPEHEVEVRLAEIEQLLIRKNGRHSLHDLSLSYARETAAQHATEEEADAARQRLYGHLHKGLKQARDVLRTTRTSDDGEVRQARHWLDTHAQELQAAARAADADVWPQSPDFLTDLARSLYFDDRYIESWELLQTVLRTTFPDSARHAEATKGIGDIHRVQGNYKESAESYREALAVYQALDDRLGQANVIDDLGDIHRVEGRFEEARAAHEEALAIYREIGDSLGQANTTKGLGDVHYAQGRYDEAVTAYQDALTIYRGNGALLGQANTTKNLADIHRFEGRYDEAAQAYHEALATFRTLGDRRGQADAHAGLGDLHEAQDRPEEAAAAYDKALTTYEAIGDRRGQADTYVSLGFLHQSQGRYAEGVAAYDKALAVYETVRSLIGQATAHVGLAGVHQAENRFTNSAEEFRTAQLLYTEANLPGGAALCQQALDFLAAEGVEADDPTDG